MVGSKFKEMLNKAKEEFLEPHQQRIKAMENFILSQNKLVPPKKAIRLLTVDKEGNIASKSAKKLKHLWVPLAQRSVKPGGIYGSFIKKIQDEEKEAKYAGKRNIFLNLNISPPKIHRVVRKKSATPKLMLTRKPKKPVNPELLKKSCPEGKIRNPETGRCVHIERPKKIHLKKVPLKEKDFESLLNLIKTIKKPS
jgi:hypothetical protein